MVLIVVTPLKAPEVKVAVPSVTEVAEIVEAVITPVKVGEVSVLFVNVCVSSS